MHALHEERPCAVRSQPRRQSGAHADGDSWAVSVVRCAGSIPALRAEVPTRSSTSVLNAGRSTWNALNVEVVLTLRCCVLVHVAWCARGMASFRWNRWCGLAMASVAASARADALLCSGELRAQVEQVVRTGDGWDCRVCASAGHYMLGRDASSDGVVGSDRR